MSRNKWDLLETATIQAELVRLLPYTTILYRSVPNVFVRELDSSGNDADKSWTGLGQFGRPTIYEEREVEHLKYDEFFQKFYFSRGQSGIDGWKAQNAIVEFFLKYSVKEDCPDGFLRYESSAYIKWFKGTRYPEDIWPKVEESFDENRLFQALLKNLNEVYLRKLLERFEVVLAKEEVPDRRQFAKALTSQFHCMVRGKGEAENIVPTAYKIIPEHTGYEAYLRESLDKFKSMRLPNEDEYQLNEFFVCSNIGTSAVVYPHRSRGQYIENATLEKIRTFDRRAETWCALIIGACGCGKTVMLQHLFVESAEHYSETGYLPVFAELRHFDTDTKSLLAFLVYAAQKYDSSFTEENAVDLLSKGQMQILLDGLDEMNDLETNHFQSVLSDFRRHYPNNQIVISSRQCGAISGISRCVKLYLHPLDETQSEILIDNLLQGNDDEEAKSIIASFFEPDTGYVLRNGFVATNPMLLTIMVRNYVQLQSLSGDRLKFYKLMYDALVFKHDDEKEAYGRLYHSVSDSQEFTEMFRQLCGLSYLDRVYQFDHRSFEMYFKKLNSEGLTNRSIFKLKSFQQDACATCCMMYEQETGFYYIDPGFQDYFAAEYFYFSDPEDLKKIGQQFWNVKPDPNRNQDAYKHFHQMSSDKMEVCFYLPYLESIFSGQNDEQAFRLFLSKGYGEIRYSIIDDSKLQSELTKYHIDRFGPINRYTCECNLMHQLLYNQLRLQPHCELGAIVGSMKPDRHAIGRYLGLPISYADNDSPFPSQIREVNGQKIIRITSGDPYQYYGLMEVPLDAPENGKPTVGYTFKVDPMKLELFSEQMRFIMRMSKHEDAGVYDAFCKFKDYYRFLLQRQKVNAFR